MTRYCLIVAIAVGVSPLGCAPAPESEPEPAAQELVQVDKEEIDFGTVIVGRRVYHTYTIFNRGKRELILQNPTRAIGTEEDYDLECKLSAKTIPPGGKTTARLMMRPLKPRQTDLIGGVYVNSNFGVLRFGGRMNVQNALVFEPEEVWRLDTRPNGELADYLGTVHSSLEGVQITSIESDEPSLEISKTPLEAGALKNLNAKSGFRLKLRVANCRVAGRFVANLTVKTDRAGNATMTVKGLRWGPIVIPRKPGWNPSLATLDLGRFPAAKGAKGNLIVVLPARADGRAVDQFRAVSDASFLKVTWQKDSMRSTSEQNWMILSLAVAPGQLPEARGEQDPITVTITTNHPRATTIRFLVTSYSY